MSINPSYGKTSHISNQMKLRLSKAPPGPSPAALLVFSRAMVGKSQGKNRTKNRLILVESMRIYRYHHHHHHHHHRTLLGVVTYIFGEILGKQEGKERTPANCQIIQINYKLNWNSKHDDVKWHKMQVIVWSSGTCYSQNHGQSWLSFNSFGS